MLNGYVTDFDQSGQGSGYSLIVNMDHLRKRQMTGPNVVIFALHGNQMRDDYDVGGRDVGVFIQGRDESTDRDQRGRVVI
jgi:hypothetical protein